MSKLFKDFLLLILGIFLLTIEQFLSCKGTDFKLILKKYNFIYNSNFNIFIN